MRGCYMIEPVEPVIVMAASQLLKVGSRMIWTPSNYIGHFVLTNPI